MSLDSLIRTISLNLFAESRSLDLLRCIHEAQGLRPHRDGFRHAEGSTPRANLRLHQGFASFWKYGPCRGWPVESWKPSVSRLDFCPTLGKAGHGCLQGRVKENQACRSVSAFCGMVFNGLASAATGYRSDQKCGERGPADKGWTQVDSYGDVSIVALEITQNQQSPHTFNDNFGGGWRWGVFEELTTTSSTFSGHCCRASL
jgi:hypothetical protein